MLNVFSLFKKIEYERQRLPVGKLFFFTAFATGWYYDRRIFKMIFKNGGMFVDILW